MKKPLIVIAGPTACGKSAVSVELAKIINGEIISADSMQVYRGMDIGTAKITKEEMGGIKHYLIDCLNPDEEFSVAVFQTMAKKAIDEILGKGKIPILVGGTGFYINALINDNDFSSSKRDYAIREKLKNLLEEKGAEFIYNKLKEYDPEYASTVHQNNTKKVIRALEYCLENNEKFSEYNKREKLKEPIYDLNFFVLNMDREKLYNRIEKRIDIMLKDGLVEEVKSLYSKYDENLVSMKGLGYKEIVYYLKGKLSLEESITLLKRDTRHFAKRQLTWFNHQCDGNWINVDNFTSTQEIAIYIKNEIARNKKC